MATKKIFRLDLFIEWLRENFVDRNFRCLYCPISKECFEFAYERLCDEDYAEDFKQEIIDKFSTEVEVVEDENDSKEGYWIYLDNDELRYDSYRCSSCNRSITVDAERKDDIGFIIEDMKYCPNCGAKMVDPQESEDKE